MKKLKASASDFIVDESDNRLYAIGSKINVFDLTTLKKIGSISGFHYLTAACLVRKHGIMFVATNNDECWTVSPGDYTKIKRFRVRLHDSDVYTTNRKIKCISSDMIGKIVKPKPPYMIAKKTKCDLFVLRNVKKTEKWCCIR